MILRHLFPSALPSCPLNRLCVASALLLIFATPGFAQDRTVLYGVADAGVSKAANWGLDTAWYSEDNVRRGSIFMGSNNVDIVRISFTTTNALVAGQLGANQLFFLTNRLTWVGRWGNPSTTVCINEDSPTIDPWYYDGSVVNSTNWAANIAAHAKRAKEWGRTVVAVAPYNEPDLYRSERQANMQKFFDTAGFLITNSVITTNNIRISGGNTLNTDQANPWYNFLKPRLDEGNTHQLAGNFDNFASFFANVVANGDHATDDEMHNVMEAMVGVEYGLNTGIWWGTAERARGEFVKASDGVRLGYAEHRPNWTAASVYRGTNGAVQAFVGESERQALPTTYRFFSKDRDVFYDGDGPRRDYLATTTGGSGYQTSAHKNAERVVNITWGADVQPMISGRYILVARHSLKAMTVESASTNNGANIQQNTYTGGTHQQWDVTPLPRTSGGDYSYHSITAAHSGKAPDVFNFSLNDGGDVRQYQLPGSFPGVNQQWFLEYVSNGWFHIRSRWSGKYLDVAGISTADGANIHQWSGTGGLNQLWRFIPVGASPTDVSPPGIVTGLSATANPRSVQLSWNASAWPDLAGYTVLRSTNSGGPYDTVARGLTNNTFTDKSANETRTYYYVVKAVDKSWNSSVNSAQVSATPSGGAALVARYAFDGNLTDSSVNANHPIVTNGSPTFVAAQYGSAMTLDGASQYTMLPANLLAGVTNFTMAAWVYWNGGGNWQRIFDFGNGTVENMFLTPSSGSGTLRFAITTNGGGAEQQLNAPALPVGQWRHIAVTLEGSIGRLYTNGVLAATNLMTLTPASFNPALNYLGKSQYPDPLFNGRLDDLFVYNHALSASEVLALANLAPYPPMKLAGAIIGSPGSYGGLGNTVSNAFDSNTNTYYDAANASGDWAGLDLGTARVIAQIKYAPRALLASRMVGGVFQGANVADFSTNVVTLFTVTATPPEGVLTTQLITNNGSFRYVRYLGPANGYCNVSELEFYEVGVPDPPVPPTVLAAVPGDGQVGLSWSTVTAATSYNVKRSTISGGPYTTIASTTATNLTDTSVANGTAYYYVVSTISVGGEGANSTQVSAQPVSTAPVNIAISESGGSLTLSWPADHMGWRLQAQTNRVATGLGTNWHEVAGSQSTNIMTLPVGPNDGTVFFRLIYP